MVAHWRRGGVYPLKTAYQPSAESISITSMAMGKWSRQEATIHQNIAIDATHNTNTLRYPYPTNQTFKGGLEILFISWTHHHLD